MGTKEALAHRLLPSPRVRVLLMDERRRVPPLRVQIFAMVKQQGAQMAAVKRAVDDLHGDFHKFQCAPVWPYLTAQRARLWRSGHRCVRSTAAAAADGFCHITRLQHFVLLSSAAAGRLRKQDRSTSGVCSSRHDLPLNIDACAAVPN